MKKKIGIPCIQFPVFIEKSLCLPWFTLFFPFSEKKIQPATAKKP